MNAPLALSAYRGVIWALQPLARPYLQARARAGKEEAARLGERFGRATLERPAGRLAWLHGASVGETRVLMLVREALAAAAPDLAFLFTTGTRTSAELLSKAAPPRTLHQFAPIDTRIAVRRFLAHWRPDLGVFAESEMWPNTLLEAQARGVRLALVNARMSPESLARWRRTPKSFTRLLSAFGAVLAADARTFEALHGYGARVFAEAGNLKWAAPAPSTDAAALAALQASIQGRPVWVAASTHAGEDEIVLAAHAKLRQQFPEALLLLVPRHPERGEAVAALAGGAPRRARGALPSNAPVYVADTMGEMGTLYAAAPVALVAGSLCAHLKGHNPIEPAKLSRAILSGPHVESFAEAYEALAAAKAVTFVRGADDIAARVAAFWAHPEDAAAYGARAAEAAERGQEALHETARALLALLEAGP